MHLQEIHYFNKPFINVLNNIVGGNNRKLFATLLFLMFLVNTLNLNGIKIS